jgi:serine/threonine protein kinase
MSGVPLSSRVKLIDLGSITKVNPKLRETRYMAGSPGYAPPEALKGAPARPSYDVYSCGAVLFYMLTGELPHSQHSLECLTYKNIRIHEGANVKREGSKFRGLSGEAQALLLWMLSDKPSERPTVMEVYADPWMQRHFFLPAVAAHGAHGDGGDGGDGGESVASRVRRRAMPSARSELSGDGEGSVTSDMSGDSEGDGA